MNATTAIITCTWMALPVKDRCSEPESLRASKAGCSTPGKEIVLMPRVTNLSGRNGYVQSLHLSDESWTLESRKEQALDE